MLSQDEEGRGRIKLIRHNPEGMRDTRGTVRRRSRYEEIDKYTIIAAGDAKRICEVQRFRESEKKKMISLTYELSIRKNEE